MYNNEGDIYQTPRRDPQRDTLSVGLEVNSPQQTHVFAHWVSVHGILLESYESFRGNLAGGGGGWTLRLCGLASPSCLLSAS